MSGLPPGLPTCRVSGPLPGWSLGERCRRAPGFRPIAAGLVKIGLPGNVGLSSSSNAARRVCAESAPGFPERLPPGRR